MKFYGSFCRKTPNILFAKMHFSTNANDESRLAYALIFKLRDQVSNRFSYGLHVTPVNLELKEDSFWRKNG